MSEPKVEETKDGEEFQEKTKDENSFAIECAPETVTLADMNAQNEKYWNNK
jgi:hypothetical protein